MYNRSSREMENEQSSPLKSDENARADSSSNKLNSTNFKYCLGFLLLSGICSGLGNSLEPVSILAVLQYFFMLLAVDEEMTRSLDWKYWTPCFIILQAAGMCFGLSGVFGYPQSIPATVAVAFAFGLFFAVLLLILVVFPYRLFTSYFFKSTFRILLFPILQTMVSCSIFGNIISVFPSTAVAVLDYQPLRSFAALFGKNHTEKQLQRVGLTSVAVLSVIFITTGFLYQAPYLYQVNANHLVVTGSDSLSVSCGFEQTAKIFSAEWFQLWNATQTRVLAGDSIVMMSEEAMTLENTDEENIAIVLAMDIAKQSTNTRGTLIGLTYLLNEPDSSMFTNHFTLVSSSSEVLWNYRKAHPVPLVESDIIAGPDTLPTANSAFGKLGGGICFDLDYPQYIAQAGRKQVDIFLQPSWTWGALLSRHFDGDAIRAIENGFTLFRCSSVGESGIVDPRGKVLTRQITGDVPSQASMYILPLLPRVNTMFPYFGFLFEYAIIVLSFGIYVYIGWKARSTYYEDIG